MSKINNNNTEETVKDEIVVERAPREVDERKDETRPSDDFIPQSLLPTPEPQDGWVFRWVRTQILGESDNINVSGRFREGWEPVLSENHPELKIRSKEVMEKRDAYYRQQAENQMEGVDRTYLRENDSRMPLMNPERDTKIKFGGNS